MNSKEVNYKQYPGPIGIFLLYTILSVIGIILLDLLASFLIRDGSVDGFFSTLLSTGLMIVVFIVECLIFGFAVNLISSSHKVYRGRGLFVFSITVSVLSVITFIIMFIYMRVGKADYSFFNYLTLLLECLIFPIMSIALPKRCKKCGLINSYVLSETKTDDLGEKHKFHNEGGYQNRWKTSAGMMIQDVPRYAVYDGLFEKKRTTRCYKCCVCGEIKVETETKEKRVDI